MANLHSQGVIQMKKVISLLLIGLVASLAVVVVSPAGAKKGHPKGTAAAKRHTVGGVVQAVGSDSITLTRKKGSPVTIQVDGDTKIVVNGKAGTLSDVKVGYVALAKLAKAGAPAKLLRAHAAPAPGTIVAGQVDSVGANSITREEARRQLRDHPARREHEDPRQREGRHARRRRDRLPRVRPAHRRGRAGSRDPGLREEAGRAQAARPRRRRFRRGRTRSRSRGTAGARRQST